MQINRPSITCQPIRLASQRTGDMSKILKCTVSIPVSKRTFIRSTFKDHHKTQKNKLSTSSDSDLRWNTGIQSSSFWLLRGFKSTRFLVKIYGETDLSYLCSRQSQFETNWGVAEEIRSTRPPCKLLSKNMRNVEQSKAI